MKVTKNLLILAICSLPYLMFADDSGKNEQDKEEKIMATLLEDINFFGFEDTTPTTGHLIVFNQEGDVLLKVQNSLEAIDQLSAQDRQMIMDSDLLMETAQDKLVILN